MKTGSLLAVAGLVICFAVPTFSQQKNTAAPQIVQQRDLLGVAKAVGEFGELGVIWWE